MGLTKTQVTLLRDCDAQQYGSPITKPEWRWYSPNPQWSGEGYEKGFSEQVFDLLERELLVVAGDSYETTAAGRACYLAIDYIRENAGFKL